MVGYTVLATRYRPRIFDDVVGQADAAHVLRAAIEGGRSAHAYLFSGPRGVGKTSMARILAKAWNCLVAESGLPCGTCAVCRAIDESSDCLDVVEIDGASHNRVENVRDLIDAVRFRPVEARYRVYIVDEVHMLSTSAFNALLKTLEEPPAHAKFILATTELLKVPETIRSRCQLIDFRRLALEDMRARLADICVHEGVPVPDGLLDRVARHARGGLRDALSLLDQLITYGDGKPTIADFERLTGRLAPEALHELLGGALAGDGAAVLNACQDAFARGARGADLVEQLTEILEGLLVTVAGSVPADRTAEERQSLQRLATQCNLDQVVAMLDVLVEANRRLRQRHDSRLVTELALLNLARVKLLTPLGDLLASGGLPAAAASAGSRLAPAAAAAPSSPRGVSRAPATRAEPAVTSPDSVVPAHAPASTPRAPGPRDHAEPGQGTDFAERFIEAVSRVSRSLRLELQRYPAIRVEGDELLMERPSGGAPLLFDPTQADVARRFTEAGNALTGRSLRLRVLQAGPEAKRSDVPAKAPQPMSSSLASAGSAASAASAASAPTDADARRAAPEVRRPPAGNRPDAARPSDVEQRILKDWPGSERVDF